MGMSTNTLKVIRLIIAVIGIASIVHAYTEHSTAFLITGIVAIVVSLFLKRIVKQRID